jgi:UDP-glucose 4-epimerase
MTNSLYWNGTRVLINGGAGFLGSHLAEELAAAGARVTLLDNFSSGALENLTSVLPRVELIEHDILDANWQKILAAKYDFFFHLAGNAYVPSSVENPQFDFDLNLKLTFDILEILRTSNWRGRFIFPSSAAVYGNPRRMPIRESDWIVPISPYGVAKLAAERYLAIYHTLYGLNTAALRLFSVYGPRQRKLVVYDLIRKMMENPQHVPVYGDGSQMRDFVYVKDAIRAMLLVAERGACAGEVYNVASGASQTIQQLLEHIAQGLGVSPQIEYSGAVRPGEPEKWSVNINRLKKLGFTPAYLLQDGLAETIDWLRATKDK